MLPEVFMLKRAVRPVLAAADGLPPRQRPAGGSYRYSLIISAESLGRMWHLSAEYRPTRRPRQTAQAPADSRTEPASSRYMSAPSAGMRRHGGGTNAPEPCHTSRHRRPTDRYASIRDGAPPTSCSDHHGLRFAVTVRLAARRNVNTYLWRATVWHGHVKIPFFQGSHASEICIKCYK